MTALVTEKFGHVSAAPNGSPLLRELILKLAVQGRLTGSEFRASSAEHLQSGWRFLKLPEATTYRIGKTPPSKEARHWDAAGIPWVSISDMTHFKTVTDTARKVSKDFASETFKYEPVPAGSLLMSFKLTVGKVAILGVAGYHNEAIISMQPKDGLSRDYLMRVLPAIAQSGRTKDALMGATLNSSSLAELVIPVPSIEEQHRIVAKVDELMALCDRLEAEQADAEAAHVKLVEALLASLTQARDAADFRASWQQLAEHFHTLFTTEASVDALKQTIVHLAVMGKLAAPVEGDASASDFLAEIDAARAEYEAMPGQRSRLRVERGEPMAPPPYPAPAGWEWRNLGSLLLITGGVTLGRKLAGREVVSLPYLRVANVQRGFLVLDQVKEVEVPADEVEKYKLAPGDLLTTEGGDWDKVGRTAIWRGEIAQCLHQNHVFRSRPYIEKFSSRWVELYLNSPPARDYFAGSSKQTTNLASINMTQLRACAFPVPPLAEQHHIVAVVDDLLKRCDQLIASMGHSRQRHEHLASLLVEQALD